MTQPNPAASAKRYDPEFGYGVTEQPNGDYVEYTDYAAAIAERDAAQQECERLKENTAKFIELIESVSAPEIADLKPVDAYIRAWEKQREDLKVANETIRKMGEAADAERQRLVAEVERLNLQAENDVKAGLRQSQIISDQSAELTRLREQVERLTTERDDAAGECKSYKQVYDHAIECVDRAFQERSDRQPPLLPDFVGLGDDKFLAVVELAKDYLAAHEQLRRVRKQLEQAVGLLREIAKDDVFSGVQRWLATYDAEGKQ